jgi:hypothetical protein
LLDSAARGAAQHGVHAGDQQLRAEGLDHVIVGAEPQPAHHLCFVAAPRQQDTGVSDSWRIWRRT